MKPVIFYIVDFTVPKVQNYDALGQCFLACSLPLSALWASQQSQDVMQRGQVSTNSTSSEPSSRWAKFKIFKNNKVLHSSHSDLEKASNYSESEGTKKSVHMEVHPPPVPEVVSE